MPGVAGQVDQDVHAVGVDAPGGGFVGEPDQRIPAGEIGFDAHAQIAEFPVRRIGQQFDPGRIDLLQEAFEEMPDRVVAQIPRHQPDPQPLRRRRALPCRVTTRGFRRYQPTVTADVLQTLRGAAPPVKGMRIENIAQGIVELRIELKRPAESGFRLGVAPLSGSDATQIGVELGAVRILLERLQAVGLGFGRKPEQAENQAEIVEGNGKVRLDRQRLSVNRLRLAVA